LNSGYFFVSETKKWTHLVTFSTITNGDQKSPTTAHASGVALRSGRLT
jgi:hypothetical protein